MIRSSIQIRQERKCELLSVQAKKTWFSRDVHKTYSKKHNCSFKTQISTSLHTHTHTHTLMCVCVCVCVCVCLVSCGHVQHDIYPSWRWKCRDVWTSQDTNRKSGREADSQSAGSASTSMEERFMTDDCSLCFLQLIHQLIICSRLKIKPGIIFNKTSDGWSTTSCSTSSVFPAAVTTDTFLYVIQQKSSLRTHLSTFTHLITSVTSYFTDYMLHHSRSCTV